MSNDKKQTALSFFLMGLIDLEIGKGILTNTTTKHTEVKNDYSI